MKKDLWAMWPDDFMCPLEEIKEWTGEGRWSGFARSDDYFLVEVLEYGCDGTPMWWTPVK